MSGEDSFLDSSEKELEGLATAVVGGAPGEIAAAGSALFVKCLTGSTIAASAAEKAAGKVFGQWLGDNPNARMKVAADAFAKSDRTAALLRSFAQTVRPVLETVLEATLPKDHHSGALDPNLEALVAQILRAMAQNQSDLESVDDKVTRILDLVSAAKGVPIASLRHILERLGDDDIPAENIFRKLNEKADELLALRDELRTSRVPEVDKVRAQALVLLEEKADIVGARELLRSAREQVAHRREHHARAEAALLSEEAAIDRLEFRYVDAADKYQLAASLVQSDPVLRSVHVVNQARALQSQGEELGDEGALLDAVALYRGLLTLVTRQSYPLQWAAIQHNLGNALRILGQRESGVARLNDAIAAYEAALEERTRARSPLDWAATQSSLSAALAALGGRARDNELLERSVRAQQEAASAVSPDSAPLGWAAANNNLGTALRELGERLGSVTLIQAAVAAHESALSTLASDRMRFERAGVETNLGSALRALGKLARDPARLRLALSAFEAAGVEITRARVPLLWAALRHNVGTTLLALAEYESGTSHLTQAIAELRLALEEWSRERAPLDWAAAQINLGKAMLDLAERTGDANPVESAILVLEAALEEAKRERVPSHWAAAQLHLGTARLRLGQIHADPERIRSAVIAFRHALDEMTEGQMPTRWADAQNSLGVARQLVATTADDWREALVAYEAALRVRTRDRFPNEWAGTIGNVASLLLTVGHQESRCEPIRESIKLCRNVLEVRTRERSPLEWAKTQENLGSALARSADLCGDSDAGPQAISAYSGALEVFTQTLGPTHPDTNRVARALDSLRSRAG